MLLLSKLKYWAHSLPGFLFGYRMRKVNVYIVDDDLDVLHSLAFFLTSAGFAATSFSDPLAFLEEADSLPPGCLLLDIRMPGMDGIEVLQRHGNRRLEIPVVVMTGHGDVATAVHAMKLGAIDYIEKPFEESALLKILGLIFETLETDVQVQAGVEAARARVDSLTVREREVLDGLLAGRSNKIVAYELNISVRTVEMHRAAMMTRLRVQTFAEAVLLAREGGMAMPDQRSAARIG